MSKEIGVKGDRCQRRSVSKTLLPRTSVPIAITPQCYSKLRPRNGHRQRVGVSHPPTFGQPTSSPRLARDHHRNLLGLRRLFGRTLRANIAETHLLALITEQGENGYQLEYPWIEEEWNPSGARPTPK